VSQQCELLDLSRSSYYHEPATESAANLSLMALIDREYTAHPFLGSRRLTTWLRGEGHEVNRKRVQRLMRLMGLEAVYPKPRLSVRGAGHKVYPYLLRGVAIERADQVWSTDITYIPLPVGFMYLTAVMDWHSRYVLSWRLSNTLDVDFCLEALEDALSQGCPEVFNTDQGVQFTAASYTQRLEAAGAKVSMDGKGRCLDNVFVERLWRTVKKDTTTTSSRRTRCRTGYNRRHHRLSVGLARPGPVLRGIPQARRICTMSDHPISAPPRA
jgi:putative transposase